MTVEAGPLGTLTVIGSGLTCTGSLCLLTYQSQRTPVTAGQWAVLFPAESYATLYVVPRLIAGEACSCCGSFERL